MQIYEEAIRVLNEINEADPTVLPKLIGYRIPCNEVLAAHPTVQVGLHEDDSLQGYEVGDYEVGLLGIINGICGVDANDWGFVYCHMRKDGSISHFSKRTDVQEDQERHEASI